MFRQWGSLYTSMNLSNDKGTLLLLGAAHSLNHSLFLVLPPLLDEISRDLNASYQAIGVVATIAFLIYGVGALVGGPLSDRIGEVKVISLSIGLSGVATVVFLLPKSMNSFSAGMYLVAALASFYHPTANTLISKHFQENTGGAMGIHGAAGSLGQIFTPLVAFFLGTYFDWRLAFAFFGLITAVTGLLLKRIPEPVRLTEEKVSPTKIFTIPNIWIIIIYNVFIGLLQRGFELFFPTFLIVNYDLGRDGGGNTHSPTVPVPNYGGGTFHSGVRGCLLRAPASDDLSHRKGSPQRAHRGGIRPHVLLRFRSGFSLHDDSWIHRHRLRLGESFLDHGTVIMRGPCRGPYYPLGDEAAETSSSYNKVVHTERCWSPIQYLFELCIMASRNICKYPGFE
jgi:MFS family permease